MNIAIYIHSLGTGGAERVAVYLANYWASRGFQVIIITNARLKQYPYKISESIKHECIEVHGDTSGVLGALISNGKRIIGLSRLIRKYQLSRIVSFTYTANVTLAIARIGKPKLIAVGSERNYPPREANSRLWNTLRKYTYGLLNAVVVQTDKTNAWIKTNTRAKQIVTIPNPVAYPLSITEPEISPSMLEGASYVLAVGRLERQKQFHHLLDAFSQLPDSLKDKHLVIVGEGYSRADLEEHAHRLNIADRLHLPGKSGNVGAWYEQASIFVLCSQFEGFPNVLLEAMSYGLPVISYDCDTGPSDLIEDGVNGVLVPADNSEKLAESMARLLGDEGLMSRLSKEALYVRSRYSKKKIFNAWDSVLQA